MIHVVIGKAEGKGNLGRRSHDWNRNGICRDCEAKQCSDILGNGLRCKYEVTSGVGMVGDIDLSKCSRHCWILTGRIKP